MKALAPNTLLQNRYLVVHLIGKGGMGEVYLAVDQRLGSAVALKRTFFAENETLGNAFEREARILGRLRHPVLPKVSDHFIENGNQYLVMEHISGDDLSKRLEMTQKPFPLSWVLFWSDQLLDALSYLHSHEPPIIHRDIKPQNLKLTDENNIILLDFGLSKSSIGDSRLSSPVSSNASGSVVGYTPHYAPMEQIRGTGTSPRSDIYSLSATIYQLLTNIVPPDALTRADSLLNGSPDPVQPIHEINSEVGKMVADVILKGMAVSQDLRYTNAREMQKELRDAYAQLQKAMAAHTVAFNSENEQAFPAEKTEPLMGIPSGLAASQADTLTDDVPANIPAMETDSFASARTQTEPPDFDATLRYDGDPQQFSSKQSDIKTEVFQGGIPTSVNETPVPSENFAPEATTPVSPFDSQGIDNKAAEISYSPTETEREESAMPATAMFVPNADSTAENFSPTGNFPQTEDFSPSQDFTPLETQYSSGQYSPQQFNSQPQQEYNSQPQAAAMAATSPNISAQPQAKSGGGGKALIIVGVLGLLLFLGIGAAGIGWLYFYGGGGGTTTETDPTPTVSPVSSVSPTPTPAEGMADNTANTDTNGTSNSSTELTNTDTNTTNSDVTKTTTTPTPKGQPTVQTTRVNPTPKQTQASTAGTPKGQPTVRQTPKKIDDTKILQ